MSDLTIRKESKVVFGLEQKILAALDEKSKELAEYKSVPDILDNYDDVEKLRRLAEKSKLDRAVMNRIGEHLIQVVRLAGALSSKIDKLKGRKGEHDDHLYNPTAIELGFTNVSHRQRWELVASLPDNLYEDHKAKVIANQDKTLTVAGVLAAAKQYQRNIRKSEITVDPSDATVRLFNCDLADAPIEPNSVDWIITDPPYPEQFIDLYGILANKATEWLKPGGSLLAMAGQTHLPAVLRAMTDSGLNYQWTLAYLTPGGQAVQIFPRHVNTFWKPIFWFVKAKYNGQWIGDVTKSKPNDNDKRFHEWGQSESGFIDLVDRFTQPGDVICDPFMGGGTTGVIAFASGRSFIGVERNSEVFAKAHGRLKELTNAAMVI